MTIEQTIEIPESHRVQVFFDIPRNIPSGRAKVALTVTPEQPVLAKAASTPEPIEDDPYAWRKLRGMFKDSKFSTEELFKERARDLLLEEAKLFRKISPEALEIAAKRGVTPAELGLEEFV
jgi:hypothetical protein